MKYILLINDNIVKGHITGYEESEVCGYEKKDLPLDFGECFNAYKLIENQIIALTEEEHAMCAKPLELTNEEILGQMAAQAEIERLELAQRMTDIELMVLEGGV